MDEGGGDGSGEWVPLYDPDPGGCLVGASFTAIEPGEVYRDTLGLVCSSGESCEERLTLPDIASAQFRIMWWALSSLDENQRGDSIQGDLIPLEERVSNHFTFEVSR